MVSSRSSAPRPASRPIEGATWRSMHGRRGSNAARACRCVHRLTPSPKAGRLADGARWHARCILHRSTRLRRSVQGSVPRSLERTRGVLRSSVSGSRALAIRVSEACEAPSSQAFDFRGAGRYDSPHSLCGTAGSGGNFSCGTGSPLPRRCGPRSMRGPSLTNGARDLMTRSFRFTCSRKGVVREPCSPVAIQVACPPCERNATMCSLPVRG